MNMILIAFWIVIAATAIFAIVRFLKFNLHMNRQSGKQIDFIKDQYDKGELDKSQYEQLVKELSN